MRTDLVTSVGLAIVGVLISFFIANTLMGEIESVSFQTIENPVSAEVAEPDPEIFNSQAINPTVEVCVGTCDANSSDSSDEESDDENSENEEENPDEDLDSEDE